MHGSITPYTKKYVKWSDHKTSPYTTALGVYLSLCTSSFSDVLVECILICIDGLIILGYYYFTAHTMTSNINHTRAVFPGFNHCVMVLITGTLSMFFAELQNSLRVSQPLDIVLTPWMWSLLHFCPEKYFLVRTILVQWCWLKVMTGFTNTRVMRWWSAVICVRGGDSACSTGQPTGVSVPQSVTSEAGYTRIRTPSMFCYCTVINPHPLHPSQPTLQAPRTEECLAWMITCWHTANLRVTHVETLPAEPSAMENCTHTFNIVSWHCIDWPVLV